MPPYRFEIGFRTSQRPAFYIETPTVEEVLSEGHTLTLRSRNAGKVSGIGSIRQDSEFLLESSGYRDEQDARTTGERVRYALKACSSVLGVGVDWSSSGPGTIFSDMCPEQCQLKREKRSHERGHGLIVRDEAQGGGGLGFSGMSVVIRRGSEQILAKIAAFQRSLPPPDEKSKMAIDLFSLSFFLSPARVRFLVMMMAVESFLSPETRPDDERAILKAMLELPALESIDPGRSERLRSAVRTLERESVRQAGRKFVQRHLGDAEFDHPETGQRVLCSSFWMECYEIRSKLAHGRAAEPKSLQRGIGQLEEMLKQLFRVLFPC